MILLPAVNDGDGCDRASIEQFFKTVETTQ